MELTADFLRGAYDWMCLTRAFDERVHILHKLGRIAGGTFSQLGHEAISVGGALALGPDDLITPMHRDLGAYLVRGITPRRMMAQVLGRAAGVSGGRDANYHGCGDLSLNIVGFVSHIPQSMPVALGAAHAFKLKGEPRVALNYFGDGASSEGLAHEVFNWAGVFRLPVVFICENNQYAYSTPLDRQMAIADIASRAQGYGFPGVVVDGNDLVAVYETVRAAVARARAGGGATLIECKTFRMRGHAIHDNQAYVPKALIAEWAARDPLLRLGQLLEARGWLDAAGRAAAQARAEAIVADAVTYAEACPYPDPATLLTGVYAEAQP